MSTFSRTPQPIVAKASGFVNALYPFVFDNSRFPR